ncbi:MAG: hypothetical protein ACM309_10055 [Bacillota bacterium]
MSKVTLVVFEGGRPRSEVEDLVVAVRKAVVLDNLAKLSGLQEFDRVLLYTTYEDLASEAARTGAETGARIDIEIVPARGRFHFGEHLADVVRRHGLETVLYMGGASGSLLGVDEVSEVARTLAVADALVITNNVFSSDIVGFTPADAVLRLAPDLPPSDNALAMVLSSILPLTRMDETVGATFDVDTPTDVMVLSLHPGAGPHVRAVAGGCGLEPARGRLVSARDALATHLAEIALIGRVSPGAVLYVNQHLKCRTRVFSEERGMKALGRQQRRQVVSLLGCLVEQVGFAAFIEALERTAGAAFMDSRVLFHHLDLRLAARDRFNSDLLRPEEVRNQTAREFTSRVLDAGIPVVLGGHCLVSGGLRALVDSAVLPQKSGGEPGVRQDSPMGGRIGSALA